MDICGRCSTELNEKTWAPSYRKKRYLICKLCDNARQREYYRKNPEVVWKRNCQKRYGLTFSQYQALLKKQAGACAICKSPDPGRGNKNLYVDHCHASGAVRGLLCHNCNTGLGHFKDNIQLLERAKEYLQ